MTDIDDKEAREFAEIEKAEQPFVASETSRSWTQIGSVMAIILFIAILIVGVSAQRTFVKYAPAKAPDPTSGVVIEQPADTPAPTPAYPTVYVQKSADPSQAPSPLPETPVGSAPASQIRPDQVQVVVPNK